VKLQQVHLRVNDAATGQPAPVRLRVTDAAGHAYAPFGRMTKFATQTGIDVGSNVLLDGEAWSFIDGTCEIALPPGPLRFQVRKGFEYKPLDSDVQLQAGKLSLRLTIERDCDLRAEGWYSGDTCAYFLSPHATLLEAAAEDLAVVDLLIREAELHGEPTLVNIAAFSGQAPIVSRPGHLVVVNSCNDGATGRLLLLNSHRVVYPLSFGANDGWTLSDWCDQCHRKGGLVVGDDWLIRPSAEVVGKIDAIRFHPEASLEPWFDVLNRGVRLPLVAGSGKDSNCSVLGGWRTYAHLGDQPFDYKTWTDAIRAGRTFVTRGPLLRVRATEETIAVEAIGNVKRIELIANRNVVASEVGSRVETASPASGWIIARVVDDAGVAAVTSPIYATRDTP
jgi:hypothetical protein